MVLFSKSYDLERPIFGRAPAYASVRRPERSVFKAMMSNLEKLDAEPATNLIYGGMANGPVTELLKQAGIDLEVALDRRAPLDQAAYMGILLAAMEDRLPRATKPGRIDHKVAGVYSHLRQRVVEDADDRGQWAAYVFDYGHYTLRTSDEVIVDAPALPY